MGTMDARLELRVDSLTLRRLEQRAAAQQTTVAGLVREGISRLLDEGEAGWRSSAVTRAVGLATPVLDDPQELARFLDQAYEPG